MSNRTGLTGGFWAPIPYSWPYPSRKRGTTGRTSGWRLLSSIAGRIDIYLNKSLRETPRRGTAGWLAKNLGLFSKQTEKYTTKEFLNKYSKFLIEASQRNVLLVEIDYEAVYSDRDNKDRDDLDDALAEAYKFINQGGRGTKVLVSTIGKTNTGLEKDLEVTVETQYYRKHGEGKPSIEVRVLGIPSIQVRQRGEEEPEYRARMKRLSRELQSDVKRRKFARKYENAARVLIRDHERRLRKAFDVAGTTRWLHLNWGGAGLEAKPRLKF